MASLKSSIRNARNRGVLPAFKPGDIGDLAHKLGLANPVSTVHLIRTLDGLRPTPVAPVLTGYDVGTLTLSGGGFLAKHPVRVRIAMLGSSVLNGDGNAVPDTRDGSLGVMSLDGGKLTAVVDPKTTLSTLPLQDLGGNFVTGVTSGEVMHISATDGREDLTDQTHVLWSNTLHIRAP